MIKICSICGKQFTNLDYLMKQQKYCSYKCYWESLKNGIHKNCLVCKKGFYVSNNRKNVKYCSRKCFCDSRLKLVKCLYCNKNFETLKCIKKNFCSKSCRYSFRKDKPFSQIAGKNHYLWKNGKTHKNGYNFDNTVKQYQHRKIVSKILSRPLKTEEIIHHINRIKTDNRLKNLYLFSTKKQHDNYHASKNKPKLISNLNGIS